PRVYVFESERRCAESCRAGRNPVLAPNCSNLAEVVHLMQSENPTRFQQFNALLRQVFPELHGITATYSKSGGDVVEIRVWLTPLDSQRDDLTIPLSECGTGLSQIIGLLYVAKMSYTPSVIAIDEPDSFLHPDASRALMKVLRQFDQHQYIVSTHSPEII